MPELLGGRLGVDLLRDQSSHGLAEHVWGHPLQAGVFPDPAPPPLDVGHLMPGAVAGGEHRVDRREVRLKPSVEHGDCEGRQHDGPPTRVRLRRCLAVGASSWFGLDGTADRQARPLTVEVDVAPPQRQDFADSGTGGEHQVDDIGHVAADSGAGPAHESSTRVPPRGPFAGR